MSKTTNGSNALHDGAPVELRLARLLDASSLAQLVPHLAPETLHRLVRHRGLEACGDLVTSATPAQLTSLLDLDLWRRAQPGQDEEFDVDRFGDWLEVLVEAGDSVAARTVAALDADLVVAGLSRYIRVFDPGTFEPTEATDDERRTRGEMMRTGGTREDAPECEVGGYLVRPRRADAWDAIVALLVALDAEQNDCFNAVMRGCRRLSDSAPEIDGLDNLLLVPGQHFEDLEVERERRRSRQGYAAPADARAFLHTARRLQQPAHAQAAAMAIDAVVSAYFRAADESLEADAEAIGASASREDAPQDIANDVLQAGAQMPPPNIAAARDAVVALLAQAERGREGREVDNAGSMRPAALLPAAGDEDQRGRLAVLKRLTAFVEHRDYAKYLTRNRELAFLANALAAGCSVQSRPFTPEEAADAAACVCNLGLDCWPSRWPAAVNARIADAAASSHPEGPAPPEAFLLEHDLIAAFAVGWSVLYEDVNLFATDRLMSVLADLRGLDADTDRDIRTLARALASARAAGTPWAARDAAEVLAMLDMTAWIAVIGLLDECPVVAAALRAVLDARTSSVSASAFDFISTIAEIGDVRVFMSMLPRVLARATDGAAS